VVGLVSVWWLDVVLLVLVLVLVITWVASGTVQLYNYLYCLPLLNSIVRHSEK
jgi:hypothetical protein